MIVLKNIEISASNEMLPRIRYVGSCTSDVPASTTFHSKRSAGGHAFRYKLAPSNGAGTQSSNIIMQHPG
jgi:hypothetical protein